MAQEMGLMQCLMCLDVCVCRVMVLRGGGMLKGLRRMWLQEGVMVAGRQAGMGMEYILMFDV